MSAVGPLRLGLLGAANIGRKFTAALAGSPKVSVGAIASRTEARAAAYAAETGIPRWHASYEALLADPEIDAVYIPLPNDMHAEWAIRALEAGKHVLCEKPLALTADQAAAMFAAAARAGRLLVEGYPWLAQPQAARLRALLSEGAIGPVRQIAVSFTAPFSDPANIRLRPENGGGALLDLGSYGVSLLRIVAGAAPLRVSAIADRAETGVDRGMVVALAFADGLTATLNCSFAAAYQRRALIHGATGSLITEFPNHAETAPPPLLLWRGSSAEAGPEVLTPPGVNGFRAEAEAFAEAIAQGPGHWTGATAAESLDIARTLDAIAESARSGAPVTLAPSEDPRP